MALHWKILIGFALAIPAGLFLGGGDALDLTGVYGFLGSLFLNALKMIIVPLIVSAIISGISNLQQEKGFARLGIKTLLFYMGSSLVAILTGLILVNLIQPGIADGQPASHLLSLSANATDVLNKVDGKGASDVVAVFLRMFPPNIVSAAAEGKMLGLITFSLIFGFFITRLKPEFQKAQQNFWNSAYEVMLQFTHLIMKAAPVGVFALVAKTISNTGFSAFQPLMWFFVTVVLALLFHAVVNLPLAVSFVTRRSALKHAKAMSPALLTAFSTSSSSATLPQTMDCLRNRAGVSDRVSSFVTPLGATVNMDGTALYECVAAMFIAQAYGIELGFGVQFVIVLTALLTSIGVAGIPSASLVAIVIILQAVGLPAEGIGLILVVDRILDMMRTSVNVWSDSCGAVMIDATESSGRTSE